MPISNRAVGRVTRPIAVIAAAVTIAGAATWVRSRAAADIPPPTAQHVAVPAYIQREKTGDWDRLLAQDPATVKVIVVNAADGPGTAAEPSWQDIISRATARGIRVLGYVDTGYLGTADWFNRQKGTSWTAEQWAARAERDARAWHELYRGIGGIFFDDGVWPCGPTDDGPDRDLYARLYARTNQADKRDHPDDLTVLNPGVNPQQCMSDAADVIVSWEGTADQYLGTPRPGEQERPFYQVFWNPVPSPDRFWHIVFDTSPDQLDAVLARTRQRGAGWVYVTDDGGDWTRGGNPFDDVPSSAYWARVMAGLTAPPH